MGKLIVDQFLTLDGVCQAPGGPEEDTSGRFRHGGWQAPYFDAASGKAILDEIGRTEALLLGRRTYDIFAGFWPKAPADDPVGAKFNAIPKYVASRTPRRLDWQHSKQLGPDLTAEVKEVKARHGEVHVWGSGDLVRSLMREDLVDRFNLFVHPVVLGTGKHLFAEGTVPTSMKVVRSRIFDTGVVMLVVEPAGEPAYGVAGAER